MGRVAMWTDEQRRTYRREGTGFPSNLTDPEWLVLGPLIPDTAPVGRPRRTDTRSAMSAISLRLEIVRRNPNAVGFEVIKKRWIVERTFSWLGRNRRLAQDFENLAATLPAFVTLAAIQFGFRRLARSSTFGSGSHPPHVSEAPDRMKPTTGVESLNS